MLLVSTNEAPFTVTIAWDDPPGQLNVNRALVNDLDLRVFKFESGERQWPWTLAEIDLEEDVGTNAVQSKRDDRNNVEQVFIDSPLLDVFYTVEIYGFMDLR